MINKIKPIKNIDVNRFLSKISASDNCWTWLGTPTKTGYGRFKNKGEMYYAHRVSYSIFNGEIKKDLVIDHICKNRLCVNPEHLRQVTISQNVKENSNAPSAINREKTTCIRGHLLSGENLRYENGKQGIKRICKICKKLQKLK